MDINKINKETLCVLKLDQVKNLVFIDYVPILNDLKIRTKFTNLNELYKNSQSTVVDIINFSEKNLTELLDDFSYCESLRDSYQQLPRNNQNQFLVRFNELNVRLSQVPESDKHVISALQNDINSLKNIYYAELHRRLKAFEINDSYKTCGIDKNILTISHRRIGWSNPLYKLTSNFSFEIKTNFGYGHVSYFYTKLMFKGIEIIPFSDWVYYENASFSEIIRYSKKHNLEDVDWFIALSYVKEACNLSLTNESAFIDKFIMSECEKMISELEAIINKNHFYYYLENIKSDKQEFKIEPTSEEIVKTGHELIEYRGEKISGSLNFIEKILSFDEIRNMSSFVSRIKNINLKILPVLKNEVPLIINEVNSHKFKLSELKLILDSLHPNYTKFKTTYNEFVANERLKTKGEPIVQINVIQIKVIEDKFNSTYPILKKYKENYEETEKTYSEILKKINALETTYRNINSYIGVINRYFKSAN